MAGETDQIANAANLAALLYHALEEVNWVGVYFLHGNELVVGPFQGQPACVRIPLGAGVCGSAALSGKPLCVPDVHAFEGHIACDPVSRSELVVPLKKAGRVIGVLDFDSPQLGRFSAADEVGAGLIAEVYCATLT